MVASDSHINIGKVAEAFVVLGYERCAVIEVNVCNTCNPFEVEE
jgi:hypothetical protein